MNMRANIPSPIARPPVGGGDLPASLRPGIQRATPDQTSPQSFVPSQLARRPPQQAVLTTRPRMGAVPQTPIGPSRPALFQPPLPPLPGTAAHANMDVPVYSGGASGRYGLNGQANSYNRPPSTPSTPSSAGQRPPLAMPEPHVPPPPLGGRYPQPSPMGPPSYASPSAGPQPFGRPSLPPAQGQIGTPRPPHQGLPSTAPARPQLSQVEKLQAMNAAEQASNPPEPKPSWGSRIGSAFSGIRHNFHGGGGRMHGANEGFGNAAGNGNTTSNMGDRM